jgi:hypothetical protein
MSHCNRSQERLELQMSPERPETERVAMNETVGKFDLAPGVSVRVFKDHEEQSKSSRVYVWVKNESVFENLSNRRSRPQDLYRALLREHVMTQLGHGDVPLRWSQKAGCECGCSPAFIAANTQFLTEGRCATRGWNWDRVSFSVTLDPVVMGVDAETLKVAS